MATQVKPIPEGFRTVTPYLTLQNGARAIEFYTRALGAKELMRMETPDGKIGHAEIKIGDSVIMLADEMPQGSTRSPQSLGGTSAGIFLYVENADAFFDKAVSAGAKEVMRPTDMFWGDRFGSFTDPFGHSWSVATHKEDVSPDDMRKRGKEAMAKMGQGQPA